MSPKQLELLKFIRNTIAHVGNGPTFKEMREHMSVSSNQTIDDFLSVLEREGYIKVTKGKQRGIAITDKSQEIGKEYNFKQPTIYPQSMITFAGNASTSSLIGTQIVGQVDILSDKIVPLKTEGGNHGTT